MAGPAPVASIYDGQTKFPKTGNAKLSSDGQYIKYNNRLYRVKIIDENGERTLLVSLSLKLKLKTVVELAQILLKDPTSISRLEIRERNCANLEPIADNILSHLNQQKNLRIINQ